MTKDEVVEVLVKVARTAAEHNEATHPVDVAYAMSFAIEAGGWAIEAIEERDGAESDSDSGSS